MKVKLAVLIVMCVMATFPVMSQVVKTPRAGGLATQTTVIGPKGGSATVITGKNAAGGKGAVGSFKGPGGSQGAGAAVVDSQGNVTKSGWITTPAGNTLGRTTYTSPENNSRTAVTTLSDSDGNKTTVMRGRDETGKYTHVALPDGTTATRASGKVETDTFTGHQVYTQHPDGTESYRASGKDSDGNFQSCKSVKDPSGDALVSSSGYNPQTGDWWYVVTDQDGNIIHQDYGNYFEGSRPSDAVQSEEATSESSLDDNL